MPNVGSTCSSEWGWASSALEATSGYGGLVKAQRIKDFCLAHLRIIIPSLDQMESWSGLNNLTNFVFLELGGSIPKRHLHLSKPKISKNPGLNGTTIIWFNLGQFWKSNFIILVENGRTMLLKDCPSLLLSPRYICLYKSSEDCYVPRIAQSLPHANYLASDSPYV